MQIGILSDTHDNLPKIEKAVRLFNKHKVGFVLHAGDFVAPFAAVKLKALACDWRAVFGNNDGEKEGLSQAGDGKIKAGPLRIELDNKKITLAHDINSIDLEQEKADLIVCGHTHSPETLKKTSRLIVNPGECGGWLTGEASVAIVDLVHMSVQTFKV